VPESKESRPTPELEALERIDAICLQFERAWQKDEAPSLEEHLGQGLPDDHDALLFELLMIEITYLQRRGEDWEWVEYHRRFPADRECLDAAAEQLARYGSATTDGHGKSQHGPQLPQRIRYVGNYEILEEIARGGMGVVFKARQTRLNRIVALKMLLGSSLATPTAIRRFQHEARIAARLNHPRIVPIHEIGEFEGHPWYTMDYIPGNSLDGEVRLGPLDASRATRFVRQIAETVQFAHDQGVLHRDLKPANILLDSDGDPLVADFGLAKLIQKQDVEGLETLTATGQVIGTPSYMSPEQASGKLGEVSERTDVWALGGILYACLTGRPPFAAATTVDTLLQVMRHEPVEPRELNPSIPRDLENICLKCLSKEPRHRYSSAVNLAEDLERFETGRPVQARPLRTPAKVWRWRKRNPVTASLSLLSVMLLVVGTAVSAMFAIQAQNRADEAETAGKRLRIALKQEEVAKVNAQDSNRKSQIALGNEQRALSKAEDAIREMQWNVYKARLYPMKAAWEKKDIGGLEQLLAESVPAADEPDFRGWEWGFFRNVVQQHSQPFAERLGTDRWIYLKANHDSSLLALRRKEGDVDIVSGVNGTVVFTIPSTKQLHVAWHPNRDLLAVATGSNQLEVWDMSQRTIKWKYQIANDKTVMAKRGIEWDPKGLQLALGGNGRVDLFSIEGEHQRTLLSAPSWTRHLAWHKDGKLLGCGGASWFGLIDLESDKLLWKDNDANVNVSDAAWNPDGTELATAWDWPRYHVKLYDLEGNQRIVQRSDSQINSICWNPDGQTLVSGTVSQQLEEWEVQSRRRTGRWLVHDSPICCVEKDLKNNRMLTLDSRGRLRKVKWPITTDSRMDLWTDTKNPALRNLEDKDNKIRRLAWKPGQSKLMAVSSKRQVWIIDLVRNLVVRQIRPGDGLVDMAWHPREPKLLTSDSAGRVMIWNTTDGKLIHRLQSRSTGVNRCAGWSPDGAYIFAGSGQRWKPGDQGKIDIWNASSYKLVAHHGDRTPRLLASWAPLENRLAMIAGRSGSRLEIIDPDSGDVLATSPYFHEGWQDMMTFNPHGDVVAIGFETGKIALVDADDGSVLHWQQFPGQQFTSLQWSPNGSRMAAITSSKNLLLLHGSTGELLIQFDTLGKLGGCGWDSAGDDFAVVSSDGFLQIWNASGLQREPARLTVTPSTPAEK
jgi:serine/threonine protein kinase/WD40 repeat protein